MSDLFEELPDDCVVEMLRFVHDAKYLVNIERTNKKYCHLTRQTFEILALSSSQPTTTLKISNFNAGHFATWALVGKFPQVELVVLDASNISISQAVELTDDYIIYTSEGEKLPRVEIHVKKDTLQEFVLKFHELTKTEFRSTKSHIDISICFEYDGRTFNGS